MTCLWPVFIIYYFWWTINLSSYFRTEASGNCLYSSVYLAMAGDNFLVQYGIHWDFFKYQQWSEMHVLCKKYILTWCFHKIPCTIVIYTIQTFKELRPELTGRKLSIIHINVEFPQISMYYRYLYLSNFQRSMAWVTMSKAKQYKLTN